MVPMVHANVGSEKDFNPGDNTYKADWVKHDCSPRHCIEPKAFVDPDKESTRSNPNGANCKVEAHSNGYSPGTPDGPTYWGCPNAIDTANKIGENASVASAYTF